MYYYTAKYIFDDMYCYITCYTAIDALAIETKEA